MTGALATDTGVPFPPMAKTEPTGKSPRSRQDSFDLSKSEAECGNGRHQQRRFRWRHASSLTVYSTRRQNGNPSFADADSTANPRGFAGIGVL
ncbi:hypothetical protein MTO96_025536 [Rhipicephalus appendiculatus]